MAKNKIERIDQEITKVREKIAEYQEKLKALEAQKTAATKAFRPSMAPIPGIGLEDLADRQGP